MFKGIAQMPPSASIFVNFGNNNQFSTFHENKIIQLEKFLKDLSETNMMNTSKPFRKFLEFEQYVDEDNELIVSIGGNNLRGNYNHLDNTDEAINDNNDD